jgi:hypothetical protein
MIQRELVVGDVMKSHIGGPNSTVDRDQFNASSFAESVVGDSGVDTSSTNTSSEGYEVAPHHDYYQESHYLIEQLRVSEDMIMVATRRIDDMRALMADCFWMESMAHDSSDEVFSIGDFHTLLERFFVMRTDFQQLLTDRDYLLGIGKMSHKSLREKELEVDRLTQELESTRGFLRGT